MELKRKIELGVHLAVVLVILSIPLYLFSLNSVQDINFLYRVYINIVAYVALFYISYFWLIPHFFFTKRKKQYFLLTILSIALLWGAGELFKEFVVPNNSQFETRIQNFMRQNGMHPPTHSAYAISFSITSVLICGFSLGLRFSHRNTQQEKELKELEREKLNTELAFLKNQISPHFFFNTLNNIYALIEINKQSAQESVLKLSKMMRYLLYESEQGTTHLSREIEFMQHYIDLMRLRLSNKVDLQVTFPTNEINRSISPLLFIVFIENAFKHGISYHDKSYIHIHLQTEHNQILFSCKNSIASNTAETTLETSGIGLENIRKRLHLLYPDCHQLVITQSNTSYEVRLIIAEKNCNN